MLLGVGEHVNREGKLYPLFEAPLVLELSMRLKVGTSVTVNQNLLDEIVRRVVDVEQPDRIILFGSAARGQMGLDSDVDGWGIRR